MNFLRFINYIIKAGIMVSIFTQTISCTKKQNVNNLERIDFLHISKSELNLSDIATNIEYIPLKNDSVLATITSVVSAKEEYYIADNKSKLLRFNANGELLNPIGKKGRGPGEYRFISNLTIHPETNNIYHTGGNAGEILIYSVQGNFIRSLKRTVENINSLAISRDNLFLFYLNNFHNKENIELLDTEGKSIKCFPNKYKFERNRAKVEFSGECLTFQFNGKLHFKELFSDTVFYIEGNQIIPKLILDSEQYRFTPQIRTSLIQNMSKDRSTSGKIFLKNIKKYIIQKNIFESSRFIFFSYDYNNSSHTIIHDKKSKTQRKFKTKDGMLNNLDGGPSPHLKFRKDDNTIITWVNAIELKKHVESNAFKNSKPKFPEKKKYLERLANSLDENDNPVLMLVTLKE